MKGKHMQWFHSAVSALGYQQQPYYLASASRYVRTLDLASTYVTFDRETSVADVGVGMMLFMLRVGAGCQATAYGIAADAIWADLGGLGIDCVEWDLHQELPETALRKPHDVVFFCEVIEHLCRFPIEVLADMKKLVQPGGYLIVTTVNFLRLSNRLRVLRGKSPLINPFKRTPNGHNHIREFHLQELSEYIQEAGFEVLEARHWGVYDSRLAGALLRPIEWFVPSLRNYMAFVARRPTSDPS